MKKLFPLFLLFLSLLSLVSCTITKRKYTGGFYVNWHSKAPEARVIPQAQRTREALLRGYVMCKLCLPNNNLSTTYPNGSLLDKAISPRSTASRVLETIKLARRSNEFQKNSATYSVTQENTASEKDKPKEDNSGWKLAIAIICCILGVIGALIVVGIIASAPFFSGASLPLAKGLSDALFPLILMFASLIFSDSAMKNGHNRGLIACMILDCIFLLVLLFTVLSL